MDLYALTVSTGRLYLCISICMSRDVVALVLMMALFSIGGVRTAVQLDVSKLACLGSTISRREGTVL